MFDPIYIFFHHLQRVCSAVGKNVRYQITGSHIPGLYFPSCALPHPGSVLQFPCGDGRSGWSRTLPLQSFPSLFIPVQKVSHSSSFITYLWPKIGVSCIPCTLWLCSDAPMIFAPIAFKKASCARNSFSTSSKGLVIKKMRTTDYRSQYREAPELFFSTSGSFWIFVSHLRACKSCQGHLTDTLLKGILFPMSGRSSFVHAIVQFLILLFLY